MKKLIIILLILSLIIATLSSCKKEAEIEKPLIENEIEGKVEIESENKLSNLGIYLPTIVNLRVNEQNVTMWEQELSKLSNVTFNIAYIDTKLNEKPMTTFSQGLDRLVYINSPAMLDELIEQGLVMPLNGYLDEINGSKNIDQAYYEPYTDTDGNIYALPAFRSVNYLGIRYYNAEWLSQFAVNAPSTIDEFTKLAENVRDSSIRSNYRQAYIADFNNYYSFTRQFTDVFLAYGCRPSRQTPNITYIDEKNEYEDMALTEEFREALIYLKYLEENDLIINTVGISREDKVAKYDIGWTIEDPMELGLYLEGKSDEKLLMEITFFGGFAVLKDCEDVKDKLSFLINRVFVEEELLESINYGIRGYNFDENDACYYYINNDDGSYRPWVRMRINIITDLYNSKGIYSSLDDYLNNQENYKISREKRFEYFEKIDLLKSNQPQTIVVHDLNKELPVGLNEITREINQSFGKLIESVFTNEQTIDEAIETYRQLHITNGYKAYFDELNGY